MAKNPPLFRPESFKSRQMSWLGQPAVLQNVSTGVVAIISIIIVISIILFLYFGNYTRRVAVSGVISPTEGLTRITSPNNGWISHQFVKEGDDVKRGEPLYEVSFDSSTSLGNTQAAINQLLREQREEIQAEITRSEEISIKDKQALQNRSEGLEQEISQIDNQIATMEEFLETLHGYAMKQKEYVDRGYTVSQAFESRLQTYIGYRDDLENYKRQRIILSDDLNEMNDTLASFDLKKSSEIAELKRQLINVEQQIAEGQARESIRITAPRNGQVTSVIKQEGQTVDTGTPLLTILPDYAELKAQLLVPSNDIGFLKEGDKVQLRYAAFPYQKFGQYPGIVSNISRAPLKQDEIRLLVDEGAAAPESTAIYRISVRPDTPFAMAYGAQIPLQAGMQVEAHVLVETRPLYQWIFEPLYGLSEVLSSGEATQ
ncbi:HlyD family secretion protein [Halomonas binhaiensis]|uniref:HlyD family efflux transporter periplasmic adaptor subunit n=1 Tax=Halomonas binhaiensis TaxID=2562282 RepID=A0A5C1NEU1_9GAMM|nr:HlyD family efflux transporter periplasmic adaptor subunit [Halomonas binhaiensis]QEM80687.1 HlyD family efflux transporter periplasmic adaptor subunit [Halomonas binhaiensis]